jgi:phage protein D
MDFSLNISVGGGLPVLSGAAYVQPAECIVKVAGQPITDLYPYVTEVSVDATRSRFTEGTITFFSPVDEKGYWLVADDPRLVTWADVTVEADFQTGTEEVLRGVIFGVEPSFPTNAGAATVRLVCRDDSARLDRGTKQRRWGKQPVGTTDQVILQTIAGEAGLAVDPTSGIGQVNVFALQQSTDIAFLQERATANGYELIFRAGMIYFGPRRLTLQSQPTIMVYAGRSTNCRSFSARGAGQQRRAYTYAKRNAHGDPGALRTVEADLPLLGLTPAQGSGSGLPDQVGFVGRRSVPDDAQSEALARARANDGDMSIQADGELDGSVYGHVLRVAEPVEIDGVGERYSGTYYVDSVTHRFDTKGYDQRFSLLRNALGRKPGGGLLGAIASLV